MGAALFMCAGTAMAQDAASDQAEEETELVVTGSRIKQPNAFSNSPIAQVSAETLDFAGLVNVETVLNQWFDSDICIPPPRDDRQMSESSEPLARC